VSELDDRDEGVMRTYDLSDEEAEIRAAKQRMSYDELAEWGVAANARARAYASELLDLRARLESNDASADGESVGEPESSPVEAQNGYLGDKSASVGGSLGTVSDLVQEAPREAVIRQVLIQLLPEVLPDILRDILPRTRGVPTRIPGEELVLVPAEECVSRTYGSVVLALQKLLARAYSVSPEAAYFAAGVSEPVCNLLESLSSAAPQRPVQTNVSRSLP
jgi:hypothetical protein